MSSRVDFVVAAVVVVEWDFVTVVVVVAVVAVVEEVVDFDRRESREVQVGLRFRLAVSLAECLEIEKVF